MGRHLTKLLEAILKEYQPMDNGEVSVPQKPKPPQGGSGQSTSPSGQGPTDGNSGESEATKQAHHLGLVSKGWGRWADPNTGQIVAKTISGHLVKSAVGDSHDWMPTDHESAYDSDDSYHGYGLNSPDSNRDPEGRNVYNARKSMSWDIDKEPEDLGPKAASHGKIRAQDPSRVLRKDLYQGYQPSSDTSFADDDPNYKPDRWF